MTTSDLYNSLLLEAYPVPARDVTIVTDTESPYSAVAGELIYIDASSGAVTVTIPEATIEGQRIKIHVIDATNTITIQRSGSDTLVGATQFDASDVDTVDYEFIAVGTAPADWKFTEAVHRTYVEGYADSGDATTLGSAQTYADSGDSTTLSSAQSYADSGDATTLGSAQTYADSGDSTTLSSAQSYADSGDSTTLSSAQSYADSGDSTTLSSAQSYADAGPLSYTITDIGYGDSGSTLAFKTMYNFDDTGASASSFTLPTIGTGDYGKRIIIFVDRNPAGFSITSNAADVLNGSGGGTYTVTATTNDRYIELLAFYGSLGTQWILHDTAPTM